MIDKKSLIWAIPIVVLLVAFLKMPYGYYSLVKLILCASSLFLAFKESKSDPNTVWVWILGLTAVLYNPIIQFHLGREVWTFVNIVTIVEFVIHWKQRRDRITV